MTPVEELRTTLSTKGQVILPKSIRRSRRWEAGTQLSVEDTAAGVLLRPVPIFPRTDPEKVFGCLPFSGKPKTLEEMDAEVMGEARRRHAGD